MPKVGFAMILEMSTPAGAATSMWPLPRRPPSMTSSRQSRNPKVCPKLRRQPRGDWKMTALSKASLNPPGSGPVLHQGEHHGIFAQLVEHATERRVSRQHVADLRFVVAYPLQKRFDPDI